MRDKGCNGDTMGGALTGMGWRETLGGSTAPLSAALGEVVSVFKEACSGSLLVASPTGGIHTPLDRIFLAATLLGAVASSRVVFARFCDNLRDTFLFLKLAFAFLASFLALTTPECALGVVSAGFLLGFLTTVDLLSRPSVLPSEEFDLFLPFSRDGPSGTEVHVP